MRKGIFQEHALALQFLGELKENKSSFWWDYYVNFFDSMVESGNVEAMSYYVSQSQGNESITAWLEENAEKLEQLASWYEGYSR